MDWKQRYSRKKLVPKLGMKVRMLPGRKSKSTLMNAIFPENTIFILDNPLIDDTVHLSSEQFNSGWLIKYNWLVENFEEVVES